MLGLRHPFDGSLYERDEAGQVLVTAPDGRWGRFDPRGRWLEGELQECDPHLCGWVGGPRVAHHRLPVDQD